MLSVCSTRPVPGIAKYIARWLAVFQPKVPTRAPSDTPNDDSTPAARLARMPRSANVIRSISVTVLVVIVRLPKNCSPRRRIESMVRGASCIKPCMGAILLYADQYGNRPDRSWLPGDLKHACAHAG